MLLQASYGKCGDPFMFVAGAPEGGYCAATCKRCPLGTTPSTSPTPTITPASSSTPAASPPASPASSPLPGASPSSPAPAACTDLAPDAQYSCAEQVKLLLPLLQKLALALILHSSMVKQLRPITTAEICGSSKTSCTVIVL